MLFKTHAWQIPRTHKMVELSWVRWSGCLFGIDLNVRIEGDHCPYITFHFILGTLGFELAIYDTRHVDEREPLAIMKD